jgi:hypothetical protein
MARCVDCGNGLKPTELAHELARSLNGRSAHNRQGDLDWHQPLHAAPRQNKNTTNKTSYWTCTAPSS